MDTSHDWKVNPSLFDHTIINPGDRKVGLLVVDIEY
jgi:hypothetical protein